MLTINIESIELYDGQSEKFFYTSPLIARLEHSLISISKWEAIWEKPYLPGPGVPGINGLAEELDYISCMIIGSVPDYVPRLLLTNHAEEISNYISSPQSATKISRIGAQPKSSKIITSELIYYWMIRYNIPFECERWHFNRLLALIEVCHIKEQEGSKSGKLNPIDSARYRHSLNKQRRAAQ